MGIRWVKGSYQKPSFHHVTIKRPVFRYLMTKQGVNTLKLASNVRFQNNKSVSTAVKRVDFGKLIFPFS